MRALFFLLLLVAAVAAFPKNDNFLPPEEDAAYSSTSDGLISTEAITTPDILSSTPAGDPVESSSTTPVVAPVDGTATPTTVPNPSGPDSTGSTTTSDPDATTPTTIKPASPSGPTTTSTAGPSPTTTTTGPPTAEPFKIESQTFPNDVKPISAKLILQEAIQLSNQINQLSEQIQYLQASIDPDNSPLISDLYSMQNTSIELQANLTNIQKDLNGAIESMNPVINRYNSVSRVFSCYLDTCQPKITTTVGTTTVVFTGTTPAPSCNQNFTATKDPQTFPVTSYKDQQCNLRIDATQGHIYVDFTGTDAKANYTIVDLNTATELKPIADKLDTTTTSLKIQINAGDEGFAFKMAYEYIDPCNPGGTPYCQATANCSVNAAGQPYCTCKQLCDQPNSDGISCSSVQCPKPYRSKTCDPVNNGCTVQEVKGNCTNKCDQTKTPSFFERWLFP